MTDRAKMLQFAVDRLAYVGCDVRHLIEAAQENDDPNLTTDQWLAAKHILALVEGFGLVATAIRGDEMLD